MLRRKTFLYWSLIPSLTIVFAVIVWRLGWFGKMYGYDATKLTVATLALFAAATVWCGILAWRACKPRETLDAIRRKLRWAAGKDEARLAAVNAELEKTKADLEPVFKRLERGIAWGWRVQWLCERVGLLGTLFGFVIAFQALLNSSKLTDAQGALGLLWTVGPGIATAIITTIVGYICSIFLAIQCHYLDDVAEEMGS